MSWQGPVWEEGRRDPGVLSSWFATKVSRRKLREAEGAGKMQVVRGHRGHTARTRCHLGLRFGVELLREKEARAWESAQDEATNRGPTEGGHRALLALLCSMVAPWWCQWFSQNRPIGPHCSVRQKTGRQLQTRATEGLRAHGLLQLSLGCLHLSEITLYSLNGPGQSQNASLRSQSFLYSGPPCSV